MKQAVLSKRQAGKSNQPGPRLEDGQGDGEKKNVIPGLLAAAKALRRRDPESSQVRACTLTAAYFEEKQAVLSKQQAGEEQSTWTLTRRRPG
jgi:hypothetical protein